MLLQPETTSISGLAHDKGVLWKSFHSISSREETVKDCYLLGDINSDSDA